MFNLTKVGRLFYELGIIAYGIQQLVILDFRPQILPDFPSWAHTIKVFPILTGLAMIAAGVIISGIIKVNFFLKGGLNFTAMKTTEPQRTQGSTEDFLRVPPCAGASVVQSIQLKQSLKKKLCLYLGFYFLALIFLSHIPYLLFVYPHKLSHLGSWGDLLKGLAFSGASFTIAGSFLYHQPAQKQNNITDRLVSKMTPAGRIFYCTTIILFGCNHFAYDISFMVPKWFVWQMFWSYFGGAALIAAGTAILFKIFLRPVSLLLALMLFLWFVFLHVPGAISNPYVDRGNLIVSAFDALLFCGTALVLSQSEKQSGYKRSEQMAANRIGKRSQAKV